MNEFINLFKDTLEREEAIDPNDQFRKYEEWDSLAVLALLAMINENYDVTIPRVDFEKIQTVADLYDKIMEIKRG